MLEEDETRGGVRLVSTADEVASGGHKHVIDRGLFRKPLLKLGAGFRRALQGRGVGKIDRADEPLFIAKPANI